MGVLQLKFQFRRGFCGALQESRRAAVLDEVLRVAFEALFTTRQTASRFGDVARLAALRHPRNSVQSIRQLGTLHSASVPDMIPMSPPGMFSSLKK